MIARTQDDVRRSAEAVRVAVRDRRAAVEPCTSTVGGGAMPTAELPSYAVRRRAGRPAERAEAARGRNPDRRPRRRRQALARFAHGFRRELFELIAAVSLARCRGRVAES